MATIEDIDAIWALRLKATELLKSKDIDQWQFEDPTKEAFINDILNLNVHVLEINHHIVGMFSLIFEIEPTYLKIDGAWHYDLPYATIHKLALDPLYQHQGLAYDMLNYAEQLTIKRGVYYMRIDTHKDNLSAQKLFIKAGYVYCGTILLDILRGDILRLAYDKKLEVTI